jgi:hypothetical protein
MSAQGRERTLNQRVRNAEGNVVTMIDWDSEDWGGAVHLAANGSWVQDKHRSSSDEDDGQ